MKKPKITISIAVLISLAIGLQNCDDNDPSDKEVTEQLLQSQSWIASSVMVPENTATDSDDWLSFAVSFGSTAMNTSGHPAGAGAVWPSGTYTVSDDGNRITRQDGVVMQITSISETSFSVVFTVPDGTNTDGRVAALEGDYIFNLN